MVSGIEAAWGCFAYARQPVDWLMLRLFWEFKGTTIQSFGFFAIAALATVHAADTLAARPGKVAHREG